MGEMVRFDSNGGTSEGYLALPRQNGRNGNDGHAQRPYAAVIVIQEWWGLVPHIKSVTDRAAAEGFVALAPDMYHGVTASEPDEAGKLLMGLAMDQAAKDIAGAAAYLAGREDCTGAVGTVGFCAGGSLALWSATLSEHVRAAAAFYPALPWERMRPDWAGYQGKRALIHCSEADGTSSAPGIQQAKTAIEQAGGECVAHDYPGTEHAFFNDDRPEVFDSEASALAWARTLELFRDRL
ncbi:MAG: dienelactone hydrolase family protein [Micromonosporaceae bacterium]|nr:dienelactone hydrolase family protein [Micromonosporaceae bacterium]